MAGKVLNIKVCIPLKQRSGLTRKCHAICHYSYNLPLAATVNSNPLLQMTEDLFFQDEGQIIVTAASVGISRLRWTAVKEDKIELNELIDLMQNNRFDHLPIIPINGIITEFYKTAEPNKYDNIEKCRIKYDDVIPLDTNIREVIEKFANQNRSFFFLRYQRNISGLITLGNLNCKQVQIYMFSLICELERELGDFLNNNLKSQEIEEWIKSKVNINNRNDKYKSMLDSYDKLKKSDLENQLTEHFFFVDFFTIIKEKGLFVKLNYTKSEWKDLNSINELRKRIAHPTRSLIDNENDINRLEKRIKKIEDLTFRLITNRKTAAANIMYKTLGV